MHQGNTNAGKVDDRQLAVRQSGGTFDALVTGAGFICQDALGHQALVQAELHFGKQVVGLLDDGSSEGLGRSGAHTREDNLVGDRGTSVVQLQGAGNNTLVDETKIESGFIKWSYNLLEKILHKNGHIDS